ncbi:MAG TPA: WD40 repeat domain-containing protein [Candidatus Bathyarchaeia archaeon]|nr:WD40 repeat domain-containing protein [Candidatus Bathyarchaeia archaeon]
MKKQTIMLFFLFACMPYMIQGAETGINIQYKNIFVSKNPVSISRIAISPSNERIAFVVRSEKEGIIHDDVYVHNKDDNKNTNLKEVEYAHKWEEYTYTDDGLEKDQEKAVEKRLAINDVVKKIKFLDNNTLTVVLENNLCKREEDRFRKYIKFSDGWKYVRLEVQQHSCLVGIIGEHGDDWGIMFDATIQQGFFAPLHSIFEEREHFYVLPKNLSCSSVFKSSKYYFMTYFSEKDEMPVYKFIDIPTNIQKILKEEGRPISIKRTAEIEKLKKENENILNLRPFFTVDAKFFAGDTSLLPNFSSPNVIAMHPQRPILCYVTKLENLFWYYFEDELEYEVPVSQLLGKFPGFSRIKSIAFHPTEEFFICGYEAFVSGYEKKYKKTGGIFGVQKNGAILDFAKTLSPVNVLEFSPDGTSFVSGEENGTVCTWDMPE